MDVSNDGLADVLLGFENGTLSVYSFDINEDIPTLSFSHHQNEAIKGIACGVVNTPVFIIIFVVVEPYCEY